jgi:hypothetical protein
MEPIEILKNNIKILQDQYYKKLIPIRNITLAKNKKVDYQDKNIINDFWKNREVKLSTKYLIDLIDNKNIVGFGIPTGIDNKIIVIDYDNKETTNKDFLNKLHSENTLTISTPSGGFHFLFKYNELFKKNARGIFNNVDIRTNGGLIFHGIREDGLYNIFNNEKIKPLNNALINELLTNIKTENIITKVRKSNKGINPKTYDIADEEIIKLLEYLPNEFLEDFNSWFKITHILNKIGKYDIWNDWSKKSKDKYNETKNKIIWEELKPDEIYNNDLQYLFWLVKFHNEDINIKKIDKIYKEYEEISPQNLKDAKYICKDFLNADIIDVNKKLNLIRSATATAKTTTTIKFTKQQQKINPSIKIYSITHLITIADDHYNKFNDKNINICHYKDISGDFLTDEYIDDYKYSGCVIVINSILKISTLDFSNSIIYLDEINAIIESLLNSSVIKNRREIINVFIDILNKAKVIIATDATISDVTFEFLNKALNNNSLNFVINTYKNGNETPTHFIEDFNIIEDLIKQDLNNNDTFMGCFNSKRKTDDLNAFILSINPSYKEKVLKYTSASGEKIKNVNEEWEGNVSLFSPSIVQGLDYNPPNPLNTYCFVFGDTTLNPIQISQQIARNRNPKNIYIYIEGCENRLYYKDGISQIKKEYSNINKINNTIYNELLNTKTEGLRTVKEENELTELFYKYKYNEDILKSSFKYNLKTILKNKGCKIIDDLLYTKIIKSKQEKTNEKEKIAKYKEDEINKKFDDYLNNRLKKTDKYKCLLDDRIKLLKLTNNNILDDYDREIITTYKEILNNDTLFKAFINIVFYLCNNTESNNKKIIKRTDEDFSHHTFKEIQTYIKTYKYILLKYTPKINPYYFSYDEIEYLDSNIDLSDDDFNIIKSLTKTTRPKPKTTIEFLRLIKIIAKKIFNNIITQTNKTIRINKEVKKYNKICFNEYAFYKALYHIKIFNKNALICPYIKALINNEIFDNIDNKTIEINDLLLSDDEKSINSTETEDAKSTTEDNSNKCSLLPYEKINIDILINDVNK